MIINTDPVNIPKAQEYINYLVESLRFSMDYHGISKDKQKVLIVEGGIDRKFIKDRLRSNVICEVAQAAFNTPEDSDLETDPFTDFPPAQSNKPSGSINCKYAITQVVCALSIYPNFVYFPEDSDKWEIYGMIDMDFDDIDKYRDADTLFITDTHDLETVILSTDNDILHRIPQCLITQNDARTAYYVSYQLGITRMMLRNLSERIDYSALSSSKGSIEFASILSTNARISLQKVIEYLSCKSRTPFGETKSKRILQDLIRSKLGKLYFDSEGVWQTTSGDFRFQDVSDFWDVVNGHDILSFIRHVNEGARNAFQPRYRTNLNRMFEEELIRRYNYKKFETTRLYARMKKANLLT